MIILDTRILIDFDRYEFDSGAFYGANIRSKDALIAAQAYRYGAAVMTANIDDSKLFDHFVEIVPPTPRPIAGRDCRQDRYLALQASFTCPPDQRPC